MQDAKITKKTPERLEVLRQRTKAWRLANPEKVIAYNKAYRERFPEICKESKAKWQRRNRDRVADIRFKYRYGISLAEYELRKSEQNGLCLICLRPPKANHPLSVDHCHKGGRVRGLLCNPCNAAIGMLRENEQSIARARLYVLGQLAPSGGAIAA